jgi:hypothetical protein
MSRKLLDPSQHLRVDAITCSMLFQTTAPIHMRLDGDECLSHICRHATAFRVESKSVVGVSVAMRRLTHMYSCNVVSYTPIVQSSSIAEVSRLIL